MAEQSSLSELLSKRAREEYLAGVEALSGHPLKPHLAMLRGPHQPRFELFLQDVAELVGLALTDPNASAREHLAAQSARHALAEHPDWIRCASDLASGSGLSKKSFASLGAWLA